jgi:putative multicomponent Na+:H+ antiporter subunit B
MIDKYIYVIVALLPLSALMLVTQKNPYHALVIRGILGAVAALTYAILGAGDVALTEALVGTMLAVTLYVIAVRSSLTMRLGILESEIEKNNSLSKNSYLKELIASIRKVVNKYHLRLELVQYSNLKALEQGLNNQEVHAICSKQKLLKSPSKNIQTGVETKQTYNTKIRVQRLFEIMQSELSFPETSINYLCTGQKMNVGVARGNREKVS